MRQLPGKRIQEKCPRSEDKLGLHIDSIAEVLFGIGMHCLGCPSSQMETIEQAAMVHGIEPQELVDRLNDVVA